VPTADATWAGPESFPIIAAQAASRAAVCRRFNSPAASTTGRPTSSANRSPTSRSFFPPIATTEPVLVDQPPGHLGEPLDRPHLHLQPGGQVDGDDRPVGRQPAAGHPRPGGGRVGRRHRQLRLEPVDVDADQLDLLGRHPGLVGVPRRVDGKSEQVVGPARRLPDRQRHPGLPQNQRVPEVAAEVDRRRRTARRGRPVRRPRTRPGPARRAA
jgi:hypothetical protein